MSGPRTRHLRNGSRTLRVLDHGGEGPPMVLVHGGWANAHWWDFVAPALARSGRVVASDLRAHGESRADDDAPPTWEAHVEDLLDVARDASDEPGIWIGHSFGAIVVALATARRPERVRGLVLVDSPLRVSSSALRRLQLLESFAARRFASEAEAIARFALFPRGSSAQADVVDHVARRSFRPDGSGAWRRAVAPDAFSAITPADAVRELTGVRRPVALVRGARSRAVSPERVVEVAARLGAETHVIPDAHHHVPLDRPLELAAAIVRFYSRTATPCSAR